MEFIISICGSGHVPELFYGKESDQLLEALANGPVPVKDISKELLHAYKETGAVRAEGQSVRLNCTLFTKKDCGLLNQSGDMIGQSLYEQIRIVIDECEIPADNQQMQLKTMFFIIGCVVLDWGGFRILRKQLVPW